MLIWDSSSLPDHHPGGGGVAYTNVKMPPASSKPPPCLFQTCRLVCSIDLFLTYCCFQLNSLSGIENLQQLSAFSSKIFRVILQKFHLQSRLMTTDAGIKYFKSSHISRASIQALKVHASSGDIHSAGEKFYTPQSEVKTRCQVAVVHITSLLHTRGLSLISKIFEASKLVHGAIFFCPTEIRWD